MKKTQAYIIFCFFGFYLNAQNLVPNPSFENYSSCPQNIGGNGDFTCTVSWIRVQCSPDYFNPCDVSTNNLGVPANAFGSQNALSGNAYAGFYTFSKFQHNSNREYIEAPLLSPLIANEKYLVSFFVSLAENPQYAISSIGAYLSNNQISGSNCNRLPYIPQVKNAQENIIMDKNNWVQISDTIIAQGGEQYITIGNFDVDSLSDTLFLGNTTGWNTSYYYIDSVSVISMHDIGIKKSISNYKINIYPNPSSNFITLTGMDFGHSKITIQNTLGEAVKEQAYTENIDVSSLPKGYYLIEVTLPDKCTYTTKFIKN